ncbi:CG18616 [Drosophila busckii]|uniref:CCR4-NOT transcription complex subunit 10 n=1 Tax=Drosophila busckii TaxID=30019 RepID=A0A0M5JCB9_DROBS|nr:CG18616 [Drosophila busckii]
MSHHHHHHHEHEDSPTKTQPQDDENYNLLCQAHEEFINCEYDCCLELLQQLEARGENRSSLLTLRNNRAVVNFYKTGCIQHMPLLQELEQLVDTKFEGGHHQEAGVAHLCLKHGGNAITVARYNRAVIYYHRHMYGTALEALTPLVTRLPALERHMTVLVATLQMLLLIATNQLNRAEVFLDYLQYKMNLVGTAPIPNPSGSPEESAVAAAATPAVTPTAALENAVTRVAGPLQVLQLLTLVLNRKPVLVTEDGTPQFAALKAQQYYIMKDFQMAAKQLMRINDESTQAGTVTPQLSTYIANNMGVIHLRVRHYAIAAKFFQNALRFDQQLATNLRQCTLETMGSARSCEIMYNLGLAMLHLRRPKEAFQCFLVPVKQYHSNARLWFRMAEACIMEHETLPITYSAPCSAVPEPTLEFAALCLRSALTLTLQYKTTFRMGGTSEDSTLAPWSQLQDNNFCNPSKPISLESLEVMLASIYAAYSFASLRLGDHVTALEMAKQLLQSERLSDAHKLLGHMYAGEALMLMNKAAEARDHLEPTFVNNLNAMDLETRDWQLKSVEAAQNVVRYNLAVALALQNDHQTAKSLLATLTHPIVNNKALSLRRHIDAELAATSGLN